MPDMPLIDIRPDHWRIVRDILQKHVPHDEVWAFGSRTKWTAKAYSDLDLAIITEKPLSLKTITNLSEDFSESDLPWRVDIVDWATTSASFQKVIERDKVVVQTADRINDSANRDYGEVAQADKVVDRGLVMKWIDTTVGEYCPFIYGKGLPQRKREKGEVPVYGSNGIVDFHSESYIQSGGIIIGRKGSVGAVHLSKVPFWPIDTSFYIEKDSIEELYFAYYLLKSLGLEHMNSDSAVPGLNRDNAHALKIRIPENEEDRKSLGAWIATFDNKIELNTQTNQTLEQIAQALFKSWFVDFDPVKAKIEVLKAGGSAEDAELAAMRIIAAKSPDELTELKQTKPEAFEKLAQTTALFPSAMQESELGEIPEGWERGLLEDIVQFSSERVQVSELNLVNYISTENMLENKRGITTASSLPSGNSVPAFSDSDILISNIRPYFKKIWLATFDGGRSPDVLCFSSLDKEEVEFSYNLLYQDRFFEYMMTTSKGAKMPRGDKDAIKLFDFALPPKELRIKFSKQIKGFFPWIENANKLSVELRSLRDALLPKLLSGEIDLTNEVRE